MEFCVWCRQPGYPSAWGHGNGKKLYVRQEKSFEPVGAVHYYCIEKFQKLRTEKIAEREALSNAVEYLHEHLQTLLRDTLSNT